MPRRLPPTGTYAAQAGLNAFMVRDLLGHKTMAMTGRYVEKATEPLRAAALFRAIPRASLQRFSSCRSHFPSSRLTQAAGLLFHRFELADKFDTASLAGTDLDLPQIIKAK